MGGPVPTVHLVQWGRAWAGCGPTQTPPRCTKCNSPPTNGQCTNHCIAIMIVRCSAVPTRQACSCRRFAATQTTVWQRTTAELAQLGREVERPELSWGSTQRPRHWTTSLLGVFTSRHSGMAASRTSNQSLTIRPHDAAPLHINARNRIQQCKTWAMTFPTGHFPQTYPPQTPPENWTVREFLQLTPHLSNDFTAAWLTFTFPQLAATLKSIDYNVAMIFILNNNNNNNNNFPAWAISLPGCYTEHFKIGTNPYSWP